MKRGRRREILTVSEERAEKGDLTSLWRAGGEERRSYQEVKRGRRREILPGSKVRAEKGDRTSQ